MALRNDISDQVAFERDAARIDKMLTPWIRTMSVTPDEFCPDGVFTHLAVDTPAELVALYRGFMEYGYANGLVA